MFKRCQTNGLIRFQVIYISLKQICYDYITIPAFSKTAKTYAGKLISRKYLCWCIDSQAFLQAVWWLDALKYTGAILCTQEVR